MRVERISFQTMRCEYVNLNAVEPPEARVRWWSGFCGCDTFKGGSQSSASGNLKETSAAGFDVHGCSMIAWCWILTNGRKGRQQRSHSPVGEAQKSPDGLVRVSAYSENLQCVAACGWPKRWVA
jgi:hypothetical protein